MLGFPVEIHMEDTMYRGYTIHPLRDGGFRIIAETYVVRKLCQNGRQSQERD